MDSDLIGGCEDAVAPLLRATADGDAWLRTTLLVLDAFVNAHALLDAASALPHIDAAVVDAGWKRCLETRVHEQMTRVCALNSSLTPQPCT